MATSSAVWLLVSDIAVAYGVDSGPIRFHAQKLMAKVQVASARFSAWPGTVCEGVGPDTVLIGTDAGGPDLRLSLTVGTSASLLPAPLPQRWTIGNPRIGPTVPKVPQPGPSHTASERHRC